MNATTMTWLAALVLWLEAFPAMHAAEERLSPAAESGWVVRSWQMEDGLPQDSVNAIAQTRDGFLWVGTSAGLARFDGVRFRRFGLQDGLRSIQITALAEDGQGALWMGTSGGDVSRWKDGRFANFGPAEGLPAGLQVIALAADHDGSIWIGTDKGLVQGRDGRFRMMGKAEGLPETQIRALLCDAQGTLWVSVLLEGLFRGTGGRFSPVEGATPPPRSAYSLMEGSDGTIWAGSDRLWTWKNGVGQWVEAGDGYPGGGIPSMAQGRDGTVWIGIRNRGLHRRSAGGFVPAAEGGPLSTQSVGAITVDREGSVWAGLVSGGLHRLSPRLIRHWGEDAGLAPTAVTSVAEDAAGGLWVSTANRGVQRFENGRFTPLADPVTSNHAVIYCTTAAIDGSVWAAGEQCLFHFRPGQPATVYNGEPVLGEAIRAMAGDGATLWLGTYYGTLLKCDAGGVQVASPRGAIPGTISCLALEAPGILWIGTSSGLHRWEGGRLRTWTARDGLLTDGVRSLHRDPDGTLWIGTLGGGLARMKDGKFFHCTTRQGLIDDVISQILPDDFGALWLGCNRGLMRIERHELEALAEGKITELHPAALGRNEGMSKEQCFGGTSPTACKLRDGRLLFPTMSGLAEIDPRRLQDLVPVPRQVEIEEVLVDQQPHAPDVPLVLPPGRHRLDLTYTAPVLRGGEWVRFRHRLDGADADWVVAGARRVASYDSLPPGRYVFRVTAADGNGNWQESGASLAFTVQPFFWQTLWFRVGGILLLVCLSGAAAWWHLHRKHRRHVAEFARERQLQAELAHASRLSTAGQFAAALAHEMNQPLGIILSNAQAAQRMMEKDSPDLEELREILADIVHEDRRAAEVIKRLRALLQRGETSFLEVSPNGIIEDVLHLMRGELLSRGVSVQTELAAGLPEIRGDQVQLQQVLLNLLINACDAMADNPPEERVIHLSAARREGVVRISVTDQGCGLPDGDAHRIFQPFVTTKSQGMGIGLSICQSIVAAHHGHLWAEPNAGRGATFHLELTISQPAAA